MEPSKNCLWFHSVIEGECFLDADNVAPIALSSGDFVLVPYRKGHRMWSQPDASTPDVDDLPQKMLSDRFSLLSHGGGGATTKVVCGILQMDFPAVGKIINALPRVIHLNKRSLHGEWLKQTLHIIASEAQELRPGSETVISRLSDVLVVQAIREWVYSDDAATTGQLAALKDKYIGKAITSVLQAPGQEWSVQSLADEAAMSRSAFAVRFKELVAESPMQFVSRVRMQKALFELRSSERSVVEIAEQLGYESETAFRRAFKRVFGFPPGAVRKN